MSKKTILSSLLTIVLCLGLIAGTTYALFTSEDTLNISVKSATVSLDASIADLATSSMGVAQENNTFANGGGAKFENSTLTLSLMTPGDKVTFNITGNTGMATGGSGDVLAGILLSFLAQGISPSDAAKYAVYIHGEAGDKAAAKRSERSIIPSDIIEEL